MLWSPIPVRSTKLALSGSLLVNPVAVTCPFLRAIRSYATVCASFWLIVGTTTAPGPLGAGHGFGGAGVPACALATVLAPTSVAPLMFAGSSVNVTQFASAPPVL